MVVAWKKLRKWGRDTWVENKIPLSPSLLPPFTTEMSGSNSWLLSTSVLTLLLRSTWCTGRLYERQLLLLPCWAGSLLLLHKGLVECHNRTFYLEAMKHFRLLISLLLRHGPQKQGEDLTAGGRKLGETVNKVVRLEDLITTSVKMAVQFDKYQHFWGTSSSTR